MATNALAVRDQQGMVVQQNSEISELQRLGGLFAASGYFSDAREMAQAAVKIQAGKELGIPPVASMMGINIIKGKVALGGNLIASRIRAHGYDYRHKQFDTKGCVLVCLGRKGDEDSGLGMLAGRPILGESSFTEEDAKTAQVYTDMYRKYPRNMYFNRAISNAQKWYYPEVSCGMPVYVPEELGATVDENGDMVHPEPTRAEQKAAQKQVLDGKLAEIRQRQQPAPPVDPPASDEPEQAQPSTLDQILASFSQPKNIEPAFNQMRGVLDQAVYDGILAENGLNPGEARTLRKVKAAFTAMWQAHHRQMQEQIEAGPEVVE